MRTSNGVKGGRGRMLTSLYVLFFISLLLFLYLLLFLLYACDTILDIYFQVRRCVRAYYVQVATPLPFTVICSRWLARMEMG